MARFEGVHTIMAAPFKAERVKAERAKAERADAHRVSGVGEVATA